MDLAFMTGRDDDLEAILARKTELSKTSVPHERKVVTLACLQLELTARLVSVLRDIEANLP